MFLFFFFRNLDPDNTSTNYPSSINFFFFSCNWKILTCNNSNSKTSQFFDTTSVLWEGHWEQAEANYFKWDFHSTFSNTHVKTFYILILSNCTIICNNLHNNVLLLCVSTESTKLSIYTKAPPGYTKQIETALPEWVSKLMWRVVL